LNGLDGLILNIVFDFLRLPRHTPSAVAKTSHRSETSGKNDQNEYATFENALKDVLSVSPSKLKSKINAEKRERTKKPSASRVSNGRD
jgi:hypothetical protein